MTKARLPGMLALAILLGAYFPARAQSGEQQPTQSPASATASSASPGDSTYLIVISAPKPAYPLASARTGVQGKYGYSYSSPKPAMSRRRRSSVDSPTWPGLRWKR